MAREIYERLFGNYRAKVINNKDKEYFGRIQVYIPDLMPELDSRSDGIWARPANNPLGGRNIEADTEDNYYAGSSFIPPNGSWVWIFFEGGNINRPYYFGALDIENAKVLPENQIGENPEKKWTLFKSHEGRTIIISDDINSDARVEITGKKRHITEKPSGDQASVTQIDNNMTTILLDERTGKEKLLIRTYKGDFFHIDIDEQKLQAYFKNDIEIKSDGNIYLTADQDIHFKSLNGSIYTQSDNHNIEIKAKTKINAETIDSDINIKAGSKINEESTSDFNIKSGGALAEEASSTADIKAGGVISIDGSALNMQNGAASASTAGSTTGATEATPEGSRDT